MSSNVPCSGLKSKPTNSCKVSTKLDVVFRSPAAMLSFFETLSRNEVELRAFLSLERGKSHLYHLHEKFLEIQMKSK